MIDPRVASGLRDLPPSLMIPRERMLASFRQTFASFGYLPIETPHIERMEVLTGKGAGSDEVLRQIFDVTNKGGTPGELALRFDLTVPLARFVAKHVNELGTPFKRYAIGSVFRGERPAKGRFREFMQCDFDTVGTESAVADAETVHVIHAALSKVVNRRFTIKINNRKIIDGYLDYVGVSDRAGFVLRWLDKYDKVGHEAVKKGLTRTNQESVARADARKGLDAGEQVAVTPLTDLQADLILGLITGGRGHEEILNQYSKVLSEFPKAIEGIENLLEIHRLLGSAGFPLEYLKFELGMARGLDYYTGAVFETTIDGFEQFGSVASGGRYDNLASFFTDRRLPGVGASIGLDRLIALIEELGEFTRTEPAAPVLVANFPGSDAAVAVGLAATLRAAGIGAEVFPDQIQIGKQMGYGSTRGHKLAVIVGQDEVERQVFNLRDLASRKEQKAIAWADLVSAVKTALNEGTGA